MFFCLEKKILHFKQPAGTSRGVYTTRKIWLVHLSEGDKTGVGECAPLPDLSCDALPDETYESKLNSFCQDLCQKGDIDVDALRPYPSMLFGLETALLSLTVPEPVEGSAPELVDLLFDTPFSRGEEGIPINGLVWMGRYDEMLQRMEDKLETPSNTKRHSINSNCSRNTRSIASNNPSVRDSGPIWQNSVASHPCPSPSMKNSSA